MAAPPTAPSGSATERIRPTVQLQHTTASSPMAVARPAATGELFCREDTSMVARGSSVRLQQLAQRVVQRIRAMRGVVRIERELVAGLRARRILGPGFHEEGQDRKSTRLNSSHSQISYAVFCLKKKKQ